MDSVSSERFGLASGINSSLSRLAGVLGIAILGSVALVSFDHLLEARAARLNLSAEAKRQLKQESAKLAEAQVPSGLSAQTSIAVKQAIQSAFVDAFRLVAGLAAVLSWLGALLAAWLLAGTNRPAAPC